MQMPHRGLLQFASVIFTAHTEKVFGKAGLFVPFSGILLLTKQHFNIADHLFLFGFQRSLFEIGMGAQGQAPGNVFSEPRSRHNGNGQIFYIVGSDPLQDIKAIFARHL
ncbi:MAG TPA: hypothetical protein VL981_03260 [Candidatus Methylacidiphilales bacterium]|nr:hypothetical protein [Candidatus Methylacidiphilales bacterium]